MHRTRLLILSAMLAACVAHRASAQAAPNWEELNRGAIDVQEARDSAGVLGLHCAFLARGDKAKIFDKLRNIEIFRATFSNIEKLDVIRTYENGADLEFVLDAFIKKVRYTVARTYDARTFTVSWSRVSGDLKEITGGWKVEDSPSASTYLIVYDSYVDPGYVVDKGLYLFFAKAQASSKLKKLRTVLEKE